MRCRWGSGAGAACSSAGLLGAASSAHLPHVLDSAGAHGEHVVEQVRHTAGVVRDDADLLPDRDASTRSSSMPARSSPASSDGVEPMLTRHLVPSSARMAAAVAT